MVVVFNLLALLPVDLLAAINPAPDESFPVRHTITDPALLNALRNAFADLNNTQGDAFWADLVPTP